MTEQVPAKSVEKGTETSHFQRDSDIAWLAEELAKEEIAAGLADPSDMDKLIGRNEIEISQLSTSHVED